MTFDYERHEAQLYQRFLQLDRQRRLERNVLLAGIISLAVVTTVIVAWFVNAY